MPASSSQSWWLDSIGRIPLLTPAEEIELGTAIQRWQTHPDPCPPGIRRRGHRARDRFVSANLRLVVSYVSRRCHRLAAAHDREDLIQAGNLGLITAAERFDPARGYRFSTYAYWWIRQAINRWIDQHGRAVAIPGSHCQHLSRLEGISRRLEQELRRSPTQAEIASELGISVRTLEQVVENGRAIASLDQVVSDDGLELGELVAASPEHDDAQLERWCQADELRRLIARLSPPDQRLMTQAWGLDGEAVPRGELARQEGVTTRALNARLRQLQAVLVAGPAVPQLPPAGGMGATSEQLELVKITRVPVKRLKQPRTIREQPRTIREQLGEQLVLEVVA